MSGSSDSVVSVLQNPDLSSASPSASPASVHNPPSNPPKPGNEAKRAPVVTFNTVDRRQRKEVEVVKPVYSEYVGVLKERKKKKIRVCYRCVLCLFFYYCVGKVET